MSEAKGWRWLSEDAQHWAFWLGLGAVIVTAVALGSVYTWWSWYWDVPAELKVGQGAGLVTATVVVIYGLLVIGHNYLGWPKYHPLHQKPLIKEVVIEKVVEVIKEVDRPVASSAQRELTEAAARWQKSIVPPLADVFDSAAGQGIANQSGRSAPIDGRSPVDLTWTRDNCSAVSVTNRTLTTFRVWVHLNALKRYSESAGDFADSELADRLPAELVGGGTQAVPDRPVPFPFIHTVGRESLIVHVHYPNRSSGNKELQIRRKGRWLAQFTVRWADDVVKSYAAEFTWGADGPIPGLISESSS